MENNLHTAGKEPDWANIAPENLSNFQKVAEMTNGWVAPANFVSAGGAVLTLAGLYELTRNGGNPFIGVALIVGGRSGDIWDGKVADWTKTKSPTGEAVDAGLDKLLIACAMIALWLEDVLPDPTVASFVAINLASVALTGIAKSKDNEIHPNYFGKRSTFFQWATIGAAITGYALKLQGVEEAGDILTYVSYATAVVATVLGVGAANEYKDDAFAENQEILDIDE